MNKPNQDGTVLVPSDMERRQIFYWLQKVSSVTAWRRIFEFYKSWADATEKSVRDADDRGWGDKTSLPQSDYALILKGLAHCEEGVLRLGKGDKRVFKFDASGEFVMASRILLHWSEMLHRIELGDNGIDEVHTPFWVEFCETLSFTCLAWRECAMPILEPHYLGEPAPILYNTWLKNELKKLPFPDELELVPDPRDNLFVRTNEYTPASGIWEPIEGSPTKPSFLSLFTSAPKPQPPFKIIGAMNYLHGGSKAPQIKVATANDSVKQDATWRLLWRDDRYSDGTVPAKEAPYRFNEPKNVQVQSPAVGVTEEIMWAESGAAVPIRGTWLVESDMTASVILAKGERLPLHQGREVRWVLAVK